MAQFETPQFIEREAKVIGPLTFKRAGYIGTPIILIFILYFAIAADYFFVFIIVSILLEGAGLTLAFVKVEGKSIPEVLVNALYFFTRPKTFVWKRGSTQLEFHNEEYINPATGGKSMSKDNLTRKSRVADLAVKVQTKK